MSGSETYADIETCSFESDVEETCSVRTSDPETKRRVAKITQMLGPGASAGISSLFPGLAPPLYELHPATPVAGTGWEMLLPQGTQVKSKRIKVIGKGKQRGARRIRRLRYGHLEAADNDSPGLCRLVDSRFGASHHEWARFSAVCRGVQDPGTRKGGLGGEECFLAFPASSMADGPERPAQAQLGQRLTEQVNSSELGGERAGRRSYVSCGSRDRFGGDAGPPGVQALASLETAQREAYYPTKVPFGGTPAEGKGGKRGETGGGAGGGAGAAGGKGGGAGSSEGGAGANRSRIGSGACRNGGSPEGKGSGGGEARGGAGDGAGAAGGEGGASVRDSAGAAQALNPGATAGA
eukprot:Hpha_TRINITY_DN16199_c5_g1::TRINITY_DN16199_c5_g1_i1::g.7341::m.7341